MVDQLTPERRSWNMSQIRSKDTKPEILVRSLLHRMGYRFTVNGSFNKQLPGKPDIVLPRYHAVIFVHGCFWHQHKGCSDSSHPKTNRKYWFQKLRGNVLRDRKRQRQLVRMGWHTIIVWECETMGICSLQARLKDSVSSFMKRQWTP